MNRLLTMTLALAGSGLAAQERFLPPAGCQAFVSIQMSSCRVSHLVRCVADGAGSYQLMHFDQTGFQSTETFNGEAAAAGNYRLEGPEVVQTSVPGSEQSLSELLRDGFDLYARLVDGDPAVGTILGHQVLTGEQVEIDGITFERIRLASAVLAPDGGLRATVSGTQLLQRDWGLYLYAGLDVLAADGTEIAIGSEPVRFDFEGDPGFLTTTPEEGCDG